jgi:hypothetical protein
MGCLRALPLAFISVLLTFSVRQALAWNIPTHMITGSIAHEIIRRENPSAVANVTAILEHRSWYVTRWQIQLSKLPQPERNEMLFMLAARWADDIRTQDRAQRRGLWHYINFPFKPEGERIEHKPRTL